MADKSESNAWAFTILTGVVLMAFAGLGTTTYMNITAQQDLVVLKSTYASDRVYIDSRIKTLEDASTERVRNDLAALKELIINLQQENKELRKENAALTKSTPTQ